MSDLSTTAQAVLDAMSEWFVVDDDERQALAAALRTAAGCVPKEEWGGENYATGFRDGIAFSCQFLHELAAELDNTNNTAELVSLQEHNAQRQQPVYFPSSEPVPNGIACPKCGIELVDSKPDQALLTYPIQYRIHCPSCGYSGTRF